MSEVTREEFDKLRKDFDSLKKNTKFGKADKKTRPPSDYNKFVGENIRRLKGEKPDMEHKLAFSEAVALWNKKKGKKK